MSAVLWCDNGGHAFKAGTPGSQSGSFTERDEEGNAVSVQYDACPEHPFRKDNARPTQALSEGKTSGK